jgi:putative oxidoreductase
MLYSLVRTPNDRTLAMLRIVLGIVFFAHGAQKMLGWFGGPGFSTTMQLFGEMGVPSLLAFLAIAAEFFGGLALVFGLLGRVAALGIGINMLVAITTVHLQHGFFMNWAGSQQGEGFEYHLLVIAISLAVLIKGSGAMSVDRALMHRLRAHEAETDKERLAA